MQKTLTNVELCCAPSERSPAASPTSVIVSASGCPKAPLRFCSQLVNGGVVHWASEVHPFAGVGGFWKPPSGFLQRPQKMFDLLFPDPVLNEVLDAVPVVRLKGIGTPPTSAPTCGGGQSSLVGKALLTAELPGVHDALALGTPAFGIGSGGPNRHEHWWSPPFSVLQWAPTFPAVHMSQSWSFPQSKSQSGPAEQLSSTRPRVQVPDVQMPEPVQVKVLVSQVPGAAAVQMPVGSVHVRMLTP